MRILAKNRRATFDYEIIEKLVAGLVLSGAEVKSAKAGHASLKGSFVALRDGEAYLTNAHINPYPFAGKANAEPDRSRKLLLHRKQLESLTGQKTAGFSIVPTMMFEDHGLIKLEIGLGRGKKKYDKREVIKKRDVEREAQRHLKG